MAIKKPLQILLVEDRKSDVILTHLALIEMDIDFKLHIVSSVKDGMNFLYKRNPNNITPDVIFTDLNLPDLPGTEFLKKVKSSTEFDHIPVFVITTSDSVEDLMDCQRLKANDYIVKHIDFEIFSGRLKMAIESFLKVPAPSN